MNPSKLPPSAPQRIPHGQEKSVQSTEKPGASSWFGAAVNKVLEAVGYSKTGTGLDTALADRSISFF